MKKKNVEGQACNDMDSALQKYVCLKRKSDGQAEESV